MTQIGKFAGAFLSIATMISCASMPPSVFPQVGSERVRVLRDKTMVDFPSCKSIGRLTVEDGQVDAGRSNYFGSEERLLVKLRNEAQDFHANTVVIVDEIRKVATVKPNGLAIKWYAEGYICR